MSCVAPPPPFVLVQLPCTPPSPDIRIELCRYAELMTILLIRHGETALNASRTLQPADTPLSARGLAQARAVATRVAAMGVLGILASDLPRALRTAEAISAATGLRIETSALLQERNFGDWRGQPHGSFGFDPLTHAGAPPGGESQARFAQRVGQAWALVVHTRGALGGPLVVVTHGLVLRELFSTHLTLATGLSAPAHLGNTGLSRVEFEPPHAVMLLDCTRHLAGTADTDDAQSLSGG